MKRIALAMVALLVLTGLTLAVNADAGTYQVRPVVAQSHVKQFNIHYVACPEAVQAGIRSEWNQPSKKLRPLIQQWYNLGRYHSVLKHWFTDATLTDRHGHVLGHIHQKCA